MTTTELRSRSWFATWNNYPEDYQERLNKAFVDSGVDKYVYQPEVGAEGTEHIQMCIRFRSQKTVTWQAAFAATLGSAVHWETCRSWKNSCQYCSKEDTAAGGSFSNIPEYVRVPPMDLFDATIATQWQKDVISLCDADPEPRKIYWIWEPEGGVGKSMLARHLIIKYRGSPFPVIMMSGNAGDIKYGVAQMKEKHFKEPRMIIWDLPRSRTVPDYGGLEEVKNGTFFSTKYESGQVLLNVYPHIVVFSNYPPDLAKLSRGRWVVIYAGITPLPSHHPIFLD